ncbi:hypothetical protein PN441_20220 [Spirulina major CS-329]|uniref:hypothetical protein n=1 Tax=Spirulina TaxID=1154 RepID=UPI0023312F60|nr:MULTISPECIES: hypothetical protein [Spirulina]MDB9493847.1 hypothetical protein [Spirulina subsalsa CS-330]MDB9505412.1 hypothetical protein [Spirulina major CS-329]
MEINGFSLTIQPGKETPEGYVELPHNTPYTLHLRNEHRQCCDAKVIIDGKHVGTWRIPAANFITLERTVNDTGRFTFYAIATPEAQQAGLNAADPNLGLVQVVFTPELTPQRRIRYFSAPQSSSRQAGGTGLSGRSDQQFGTAARIQHDLSQQTTISLRLIATPQAQPRPLRPLSNPVPPPIA